MDLPGLLERQDQFLGFFLADQADVALELGDQQRQPGDLAGEILDLNAVEILQPDPGASVRLAAPFEDFRLDLAHVDIGDHQKVAGAAGRIEHPDAGDALAQIQQLAGLSPALSSCSRRSSRKSGFSTFRMFGTEV